MTVGLDFCLIFIYQKRVLVVGVAWRGLLTFRSEGALTDSSMYIDIPLHDIKRLSCMTCLLTMHVLMC